jgi:ABC-type multidrug transport system permease subunit
VGHANVADGLDLLFSSTFAYIMIAGFDAAENAGNQGNLLFLLCLLFCGVLVTPDQLPGF